MTDHTPEHSPMPETPWWSAPGTTAVLPPQHEPADAPAPPPPVASHSVGRARRGGTALLVALALVAGGGVGGAVATLLDDDVAVVQGTPLVSGGVTADAVAGSPEAAAAAISPSVVTIEVSATTSDAFGQVRRGSSTGSGVVLRADGYILTNNHVVDGAAGGGTVHVTLADGKTVPATVVGTDPSTDLAVIRVRDVAGLKAATFARSSELKVGQAVLAVGAPLGLSNTVTQGIISTLHRPVRTGDTQQAVLDAVQTDAAINPGNSGGALVDLAGRVVGINSAIATSGGGSGNIGVGFAIPSEVATKIADQIITSGRATHSQIGVTVADAPSTTDGAPGLGALIRSLVPGGPAEKSGLQPGDVVTKVDDRRVTDADSLIVAVRAHDPGTTVALTVERGGDTRTIRVRLGSSS